MAQRLETSMYATASALSEAQLDRLRSLGIAPERTTQVTLHRGLYGAPSHIDVEEVALTATGEWARDNWGDLVKHHRLVPVPADFEL